MNQSTFKLRIGGEERSLLFGTLGLFSYINEKTGIDPIVWLNDLTKETENNSMANIEKIAILIYAGINSYLDDNDKQGFTFERIRKWCNGLTTQDFAEIPEFAIKSYNVPEMGKEMAPQANP